MDDSTAKEYSIVEYLWIDGSGVTLRGKTKIIKGPVKSIEDCPVWNYDGSSTGQAPTEDSEVWLHP